MIAIVLKKKKFGFGDVYIILSNYIRNMYKYVYMAPGMVKCCDEAV